MRVKAYALDAVGLGAGKRARGAILTDNSAAAFTVVDYTGVDGGLAEEGVTTVGGPRVFCGICGGTADDQRGVVYFLGANSSRIEHFVTRTGGGASEGHAAALKRTAVRPLEATRVSRTPECGAAVDRHRLAIRPYVGRHS